MPLPEKLPPHVKRKLSAAASGEQKARAAHADALSKLHEAIRQASTSAGVNEIARACNRSKQRVSQILREGS